MRQFFTRTRGRTRLHWTDWLTYLYLFAGLLLMFAPVLWLVLSSLKSEAAISDFPPTLLPYTQKMVKLGGEADDGKLHPVFTVKGADGKPREMVELRHKGIIATMIDPA